MERFLICHTFLNDANICDLLQQYDEDIAAKTAAEGCPHCNGVLHSARYPRKPRGGPAANRPDYQFRFSFCCAVEGCRKRMTPPSLRFLGRRVYLSAVIVLLSTMANGLTSRRVAKLREWVGVDRKTLQKWRQWWLQTFPKLSFWKATRGRFAHPIDESMLPTSLFDRFSGDATARLVGLLKLLMPLSTEHKVWQF